MLKILIDYLMSVFKFIIFREAGMVADPDHACGCHTWMTLTLTYWK